MQNNPEDKFNDIMPQTDDRALCVRIYKPISREGYELNFLPRFIEMVERHGEARLLVHYDNYKGWESQAALMDLGMTMKYAKKIRRIALVNPPEAELKRRKINEDIYKDTEIEIFSEDEIDKAVTWVKS